MAFAAAAAIVPHEGPAQTRSPAEPTFPPVLDGRITGDLSDGQKILYTIKDDNARLVRTELDPTAIARALPEEMLKGIAGADEDNLDNLARDTLAVLGQDAAGLSDSGAASLLSALQENFRGGGIGGLVAYEMAEFVALHAGCLKADGVPVSGARRSVIRSDLKFNVNIDYGRGVFDIDSIKLFSCYIGKGAGTLIVQPIERRWVIAVGEGLELQQNVEAVDMNNGGTRIYPWGLKARGYPIRLVAIYFGGDIVRKTSPGGVPDPRAHFYDVAANACLDVLFPDPAPPPQDGHMVSRPGALMFCAGSYCGANPGVDATQ
jgi:hypothetical protein